MKRIRDIDFDVIEVDRWVLVRECIHNTIAVRPCYSTAPVAKEHGTLYRIGNKNYVIYKGKWHACSRRFGVGEYEIIVDPMGVRKVQ